MPGAPAQTQTPSVSADELIRRTVVNELAAADDGGHYQYRFEEQTAHGSEIRDVLESRGWSVDRLILKNGRPLTETEKQREEQRLRYLLTNPARLEAFQKEQLSRREQFRTMIVAFPQAFSYQYDNTAQKIPPDGLTRLKFHPNPKFMSHSWELRLLQGMEGTLLIDPHNARLVRIEARFFRDVDFGGGILGRIERGGSFAVEQQAIGGDRRAITSVVLHFNKRVLFARIRVDSITKASGFQSGPEEMSLQQGLQQFLKQGEMTVASQNERKP
jgi:hypothetical protein